MDSLPLIWILPLATFVLVIAFALWSKRRTESEDHDTVMEKSSLAIDGPGPAPICAPANEQTH